YRSDFVPVHESKVTNAQSGVEPQAYFEGASVRRHRRAQGDRSTLRSITPKRANTSGIPTRRPATSTLECLVVGREARRPRNARTRWGPGAMADSEANATTAKDEETALLSPAGFTPPAPAELAARFPNLEVMELLGHGGMGIVYKGRQPFLDRLVAIKVIRPDLQTDDAFQERFLREARTLAKLRHPFIVTVFDVC